MVNIHQTGGALHKILTGDTGGIECTACRQIAQRSPARFRISSYERRQTTDESGCHRSISITIKTATLLQKWRPRRAIDPRQLQQIFCSHASDGGRFGWGVAGQHLCRQFIKALNMTLDKIAVDPLFPFEQMHQSEGQGAIGARPDQNDPVRKRPGCFVPMRLNQPDLGSLSFGFLHRLREMNVGCQSVGAPDQNQIALRRLPGLRLQRLAHDGFPSITFGG